jgi:DNA-binding MarR family transcriptional regulator
MRMPVAAATQLESAQRLRQAIGKLHRWLRVTDASRAAGLAPARVSALLNVERNGPLRLSRLAEDEGINPTMLSRMVGDLVDAGLLERTSDAEDKRAAWVGVTPAGRELVQQLRRERTAAVDAALATLDPDDAAQIEAALPALERLAERIKQARA